VCYLDILGYSNFINQYFDDEEIRKQEEKHFENILNLWETTKRQISCGGFLVKHTDKIINKTVIRMISDGIIISMPLNDLPPIFLDETPETKLQNKQFHVNNYLLFLCNIHLLFIEKGHLLRGAISVGQHYEKSYKSNLFLYSKALVDTVKLEKSAKYPRIIMRDNVTDSPMIYTDYEGVRCLDVYQSLGRYSEPRNREILKNISMELKRLVTLYRSEPDILSKYRYFIEYHNKRISQISNYLDLVVDITNP